MTEDSGAMEIINYTFLVALANDETISEGELGIITRIALRDGKVDDQERKALRHIFEHLYNRGQLTPDIEKEIATLRHKHNI